MYLKNSNQPLYNFLLNKWYFDEIYDFIFTRPAKAIGSFFWYKGDIKYIDGYGPNGFAKIIKIISEAIEVTLDDQGQAWETKNKPKHKVL